MTGHPNEELVRSGYHAFATATQLTFPPGLNLLAIWGELRVHDPDPAL